jgi:hypothetical protein
MLCLLDYWVSIGRRARGGLHALHVAAKVACATHAPILGWRMAPRKDPFTVTPALSRIDR